MRYWIASLLLLGAVAASPLLALKAEARPVNCTTTCIGNTCSTYCY